MKPHTKPMIQNTSTLLRHTLSLKGSCMAIALLVSVMFAPVLQAQPKYGISSVTTVVPPHPITLDGFVAEGGTKIALQILPTDITIAQYPVMLKLVISGNGITIESKSLFIHEPVYLNGNELTSFDGNDLQAFFNPDNLSFSGYSKTQYQRNGRLPEGVYTVGFELYDVLRKIQVASVKSTLVFLFLNEVPSLNLPLNTDIISAAGTPVVNFRWSTRHSPLSATFFTPQYLFELWDIQPEGMNPYEIVRGTRPVYATTVSSTYLSYGIAEPPLLPGHTYAWRVRESDPDGKTLFKNNGYSEVYTFKYGINCPPPELKADKAGTSNLSVLWQANAGQNKFELRYRDKKKKNPEWYSQEVNTFSSKVENLKSNTVYEIEVCAICGDQRSEYSNRVEMNTRQNTSFKCGQIDSSKLPQNKNPLRKLSSGDVFKAFGFDVQVKEASGSAGTFTGKGYVLVPLFNFIKIEAKFDNARINEEYQLIGGEVKTVYNLKNSLTYIPGQGIAGLSDLTDLAKLIAGDKEKNKFDDLADKKIEVDSVKEIRIEGNKIIVTDANGKTEEVPTGKVVSVKTEDGKEYVVDSNGTIYSSGNSGQKAASGAPSGAVSTAAQAGKGASPKYNVTFSPHNLQAYGFDYPTDKSPKDNYEQVSITENPIQVPWKSLEAGRIERTIADITGGPADSVRYYRQSNNVVMTAPGEKDTQKQVMLNGNGKNDEDKLFAWYPAYNAQDTGKTYSRVLAGQLNLISYEKKLIKVVLVPVNNASCPNADYVKEELNKIYKSSVVEWDVSPGDNLTVNFTGGANATFDNTDPNERMDYTADMKIVNNALKDNPKYNRETYYLFFLDNAKDQTVKGFMPFKQQFGFIFKYKQYPDEYLRTIAHELGHGPFRLWHTFSKSNKYIQPQGSTDNLMDYASASALKLNKYQWDWMHNPEWRIYAYTDEDEGADKEETNKSQVPYALVIVEGNMDKKAFKDLNLTLTNWKQNQKMFFVECFSQKTIDDAFKTIDLLDTGPVPEDYKATTKVKQQNICYFGNTGKFSIFAVEVTKKGEFSLIEGLWYNNEQQNPVLCNGQDIYIEWRTHQLKNVDVWDGGQTKTVNKVKYLNLGVGLSLFQTMPQLFYKCVGKPRLKAVNEEAIIYETSKIETLQLEVITELWREKTYKENRDKKDFSINMDTENNYIGSPGDFIYQYILNEDTRIDLDFTDWKTIDIDMNKDNKLKIIPRFGIPIEYTFKLTKSPERKFEKAINRQNIVFCTEVNVDNINTKAGNENWQAFDMLTLAAARDLLKDVHELTSLCLIMHGGGANMKIMLNDDNYFTDIPYFKDLPSTKDTYLTVEKIEKFMNNDFCRTDRDEYLDYQEIKALKDLMNKVAIGGSFVIAACNGGDISNGDLLTSLYKLSGQRDINIYVNIDRSSFPGIPSPSVEVMSLNGSIMPTIYLTINTIYEFLDHENPVPGERSSGEERFTVGWKVMGRLSPTGIKVKDVKYSDDKMENTGQLIFRSNGIPVDFVKKKK